MWVNNENESKWLLPLRLAPNPAWAEPYLPEENCLLTNARFPYHLQNLSHIVVKMCLKEGKLFQGFWQSLQTHGPKICLPAAEIHPACPWHHHPESVRLPQCHWCWCSAAKEIEIITSWACQLIFYTFYLLYLLLGAARARYQTFIFS